MVARWLGLFVGAGALLSTGCTGAMLCLFMPELDDTCEQIPIEAPGLPDPGVLTGTVTYEGDPVPRARITFANTPRRAETQDDGTFVLGSVPDHPVFLEVRADPDGDGLDDAGALLSASLVEEPHPTLNFGTVIRLGGVEFGEVPLQPLRNVEGTVTLPGGQTPQDAGLSVRVFAYRPGCVITGTTSAGLVDARCPDEDVADYVADSDGDIVARDLHAVGIAGVADNGTFTLRRLLPGPLQLVAVASPLGDLTQVSGVSAIVTHDSGGITVPLDALNGGDTAQAFVALSAEVRAPYALLTPPSTPRPPCADAVPDLTNYPGATSVTLDAGRTVVLEAPVGVWDVTVCDGGESQAVLFRQVFAPGQPEDRVLGPAPVKAGDVLCPVLGDGTDCDGDGLVALPSLLGSADYLTDRALYELCAADCAGDYAGDTMFGPGQVKSCVDGAEVYDCNDDGDAQPDTTEAQPCLGPGAGTDLDGDFLCDGQDPFPWCAANDSAACRDVVDLPPQIPAEYLELPFCQSYDVVAADYCALSATAPDCVGDYAVSCVEHECVADGQCDGDDTCEDIGGTMRCRTPCPIGDECDPGETCTAQRCEPDVAEGPVMRCTCEVLADLPSSPDFVDVPADPGNTCGQAEQQTVWDTCRDLWNPSN